MKRNRRKFNSSLKAKVAIESLKERETLSELAVWYNLHFNQIQQWRSDKYGRKIRALDNIFIERFWITIEYQYIYLKPSENGVDLFIGIKK